MIDVQSQNDIRNIAIDRVGVKDVRYPIQVLDKSNSVQNTIASITMYVELPENFRGTHMSRFIEVLNHYRGMITMKNIPEILREMTSRLSSQSAGISIEFPYFIEKCSPVTKIPSLNEYTCYFKGNLSEGEDDFVLGVKVPVTSLCPCSKEISEFGAHNQRSFIHVNVRFREFVWIEELVSLIEQTASCEIFSLLKRPDEKFVTEKAYENPKFVEDTVRDVAMFLEKDDNIVWYTVEAENHESIHSHNAYAFIKNDKRGDKNGTKG